MHLQIRSCACKFNRVLRAAYGVNNAMQNIVTGVTVDFATRLVKRN